MDDVRRSEVSRGISLRHAAEDERMMREGIEALMGCEGGRAFFLRLCELGNVFGAIGECGDGVRYAYASGRRDFGVEVYGMVNGCEPDGVLRALGECNVRAVKRHDELMSVLERGIINE